MAKGIEFQPVEDPDDALECLLVQVRDMLTYLERDPRLARVVNRMTLRRFNDQLPLVVSAQIAMPMPRDWTDNDVRAIERSAFNKIVIAEVQWGRPKLEVVPGDRWLLEITTRDDEDIHRSRHSTHEAAMECSDTVLAEWRSRGPEVDQASPKAIHTCISRLP